MGIAVGGAAGELVEIELAEQDGPGLAQARPYGGIKVRNEFVEDFRAAGGQHAACVAKILERDGDAVKGAAPVAGDDFGLGVARGGARVVAIDGDVGEEPFTVLV